MINTNGLLLKDNRAESLLDAGTDLIIISIDGSTKDTYEKIRIKGNYDVVTKNVDNLIKLKKLKKLKKPLIRLQFTIMKENVDEFAEFKKQWEDKVDILVGLNYNQRWDY
jgi:MoaA/NifB/PqqE/SkfB family radical SAM enzyme